MHDENNEEKFFTIIKKTDNFNSIEIILNLFKKKSKVLFAKQCTKQINLIK